MKVLQPVVAGLSLTILFAAGLLPHGATSEQTQAAVQEAPVVVTASASVVTPELPQDQVQDLTF